jgi:membrane-associated HD superfamily phosphohydrolase
MGSEAETSVGHNNNQKSSPSGDRRGVIQHSKFKIQHSLAVIFHPGFLFFYTLFLPFPLQDRHIETYLYVLLLTVIAPVILTFILGKDLFLKNREKRPLFLVFTASFYLISYYLLRGSMTLIESRFLIALTIGLFLAALVSIKYKISLHGCGLGAFVPYLLMKYYEFGAFSTLSVIGLALIYICVGIVLWQRVDSKSHTIQQVVAGFSAGFLIFVLVFFA